MGSIYRSEPMSLCQIFLQTDAAYQCVAELGELGLAQFTDLNEELNSYQRKFVNEVRRTDEMERKLRFIEEEVTKDEVEIPDTDEHIPAPQPKNMVEIEANFEKLEEELQGINTNMNSLKKNHIQLLEMKAVLEKVKYFLDSSTKREAAMSISEAQRGEAGPITIGLKPEIEKERRDETELKFITGVIKTDKILNFERTLWRFCRGKVFARTLEITEVIDHFSSTGQHVEKAVFILFFSGEQLRTKVKKICNGFNATIYNCPEQASERTHLLEQIKAQTDDMKQVINKTLEYRKKIIYAASLSVKKWTIMVLKLKSIFHTLNMFSVDVTHKCLIAECWIPTVDIAAVRNALRHGTELSGSNVHPVLNEMEAHGHQPTHFKLNKFTQGFQNIVDAYGIANYREVNPAPWTIISFPFLFAVMFGDSGHGIIMFLAALGIVLYEKKLISMKIKDEIFNTFFGGRYVVLLMGCFSIYTGLIYNDIYSKSINIFGSSWTNPYTDQLLQSMEMQGFAEDQKLDLTWPPEHSFNQKNQGVYPFGLDPIWNVAKNRLNFLNPMKMKSSIILGISQMFFGILLSLMNYMHRRSLVDTFFVFIPQVLFLSCIFVYLCVQVVLKWVYVYVNPAIIFGQVYPGANCAPSLLIGLINMFMMKSRTPGFVKDVNGVNTTMSVIIGGKNYSYVDVDQCFQQQWYPHQSMIEQILLGVAVISIPVMLLVKPFYIRWRHNRGLPIDTGHGDEDGEFNFGDVMVYQAIHTIEFALGCISHTASYLRLWALSLAHAQLSEVLWDMVLAIALAGGGWAGAGMQWVIFWAFASLSVSILILMEGLSAFLHALRLHWVEFQSKFYGGTGVQFEPFSFRQIIRVYEGLEN